MNREIYHPFRSEKAKEQYLNYYDRKAEKWPVPSTNKVVDTCYGETFIRISGSVDAPPLVFRQCFYAVFPHQRGCGDARQ